MRNSPLNRALPALTLVALTVSGCSSSDGGKDTPAGATASQVCGGFAKDPAVGSALVAVVGEDRLLDDRSEAETTVRALRSSDGKLTLKELGSGSPFCVLKNADDGEQALRIEFREAVTIDGTRDTATFSYFSTGEMSLSSDRFAKLQFNCVMKSPTKKVIVTASLSREGNTATVTAASLPVRQVTVLNAAARKMSTALGCTNDTKLVTGVPAAYGRG
ncbi:hypothetical protein ABT160_03490 [Streptomyces sp. NPDC001941]|uniref:hypothetical protein n=1 Tax=Streptomyces sp. NPDC001941 TaxID=3154659 RepID=UPI0033278E9D